MGTFERLSVLVIGVILVMILVVAAVTWTDDPAPCEIEKADVDPAAQLVDPLEDPLEDPLRLAPVDPQPEPSPTPRPDPKVGPDPTPDPTPDPMPDPVPEPMLAEKPKLPTPKLHVVQKGESLILIARKYYPSGKYFPEIMRANELDTPLIRPGQELKIPPIGSLGIENEPQKLQNQPRLPLQAKPIPGQPYTVRTGEDLPGIAKRAYNDMERWVEIWVANRKAVPDPKVKLKEGTILQIP